MRNLYRKLVPSETRYWIYKLRHPVAFRRLRRRVNPSLKGDFSLRSFDRYRCLFVHITKSAGTSVALSLFGELPYHYTAMQYRVIFGSRTFNRYFKFAFVRNPWDRLLSAYTYLRSGGWDENDREWFQTNLAHLPDFNSFVLDWLTSERLRSHLHFRPQSDFLCDRKGRPLLDWLGYFENLQQDFDDVASRLGIKARLGRTNASVREDYRNIYTKAAMDKVESLYRQDVENFGYAFEGLKHRMDVRRGRFAPR